MVQNTKDTFIVTKMTYILNYRPKYEVMDKNINTKLEGN